MDSESVMNGAKGVRSTSLNRIESEKCMHREDCRRMLTLVHGGDKTYGKFEWKRGSGRRDG